MTQQKQVISDLLKIIKLPTVQYRTGLSRSAIYLKVSKGEFPPSISLGKRSVGWLEDDINNWIKHRIEESGEIKSKKHL